MPQPFSFYDQAVSKYAGADRGKCLTCGFLAEPLGADDIEVRIADRELGSHVRDGFPLRAFCFAGAANLIDEASSLEKEGVTERNAFRTVIAKDRHCPAWYPYTAGASPLWHHEEMRMMLLEQSRRDYEDHLNRQRKEFETALAEMDTKANARLSKLTNSITIRIGVAGILVALIIGATQIWIATHAAPQVVVVTSPSATVPATP